MLSQIRFGGEFQVEKKYLNSDQLKKLETVPGAPGNVVLNNPDQFWVYTAKEDDTISQYFRTHGIRYAWNKPADRFMLMKPFK